MKNVTVLYFAAIRELAGASTEALSLPDEIASLGDFMRYLGEQRPALKSSLGSVRVAKNEVFAALADPVETGDVLALIPPVQGG